MRILLVLAFGISTFMAFAQPLELYKQNQSYDHDNLIAEYQKLDNEFEEAKLIEIGRSDVGKPLHVFLIDVEKDFAAIQNKGKGRALMLVNNGIHPGESCGVDASLKFAWELLNEKKYKKALENVVVAIVPMYNVGGALNRACCSRANQNGPLEQGFRGNARNLDLNRDWIKADAKNTWSLQKFFAEWDPDIFIDTHTSNGADYPYIMTLISTQPDKLGSFLGRYQRNKMTPGLFDRMKERGFPMTPYVHTVKQIPDSGITDFLESPRFSTGYSALLGCFSFVSEAHMLKTFEERVVSTYHLLHSIFDYAGTNAQEITTLRKTHQTKVTERSVFPINWVRDTTKYDMLEFNGYAAEYIDSKVTTGKRLFYNQNKPYTKNIKYFNKYYATGKIRAPKMYVIPQVWTEVIERLKNNGVRMTRLESDTSLSCEVYHIDKYETLNRAYEGHYLHHSVSVKTSKDILDFYVGDYLITLDQLTNRYIVETLEPENGDSFFAWNYFDEILQQKEWYSAYVFEDKALELLKTNKDLKARFDTKMKDDAEFADNPRAQLYFIYRNSEYFEKSYMRYPVFRIL